MKTTECRSTITERVRQENESLVADIEWLETEYAPIKEAWIAAEHRRRQVYARLRENDLIRLFE